MRSTVRAQAQHRQALVERGELFRGGRWGVREGEEIDGSPQLSEGYPVALQEPLLE